MLWQRAIILAISASAITGCGNGNMTVDTGNTTTDAGPIDGSMPDVSHPDVQSTDVPGTDAADSPSTDGGGMCGGGYGTCNPVTNTGCTAGMSCVVAGDGHGGLTTQCTAPGTGGYGSTCMTADACLPGFACLNSTCVKLCCGAGDSMRCRTGQGGMNGATCSIGVQGANFMGCQVSTLCDWFAQDCPGGGNCEPSDSSGTTTCLPSGAATVGMPCMSLGECAKGLACIVSGADGGAGGVCRAVCDPTLPAGTDGGTARDGGASRACAAGTMCSGVNGRPSNYGVCVPP